MKVYVFMLCVSEETHSNMVRVLKYVLNNNCLCITYWGNIRTLWNCHKLGDKELIVYSKRHTLNYK